MNVDDLRVPLCRETSISKKQKIFHQQSMWAEKYESYGGWKKSCTTLDGWNLLDNGINMDKPSINWCRISSIHCMACGPPFFGRSWVLTAEPSSRWGYATCSPAWKGVGKCLRLFQCIVPANKDCSVVDNLIADDLPLPDDDPASHVWPSTGNLDKPENQKILWVKQSKSQKSEWFKPQTAAQPQFVNGFDKDLLPTCWSLKQLPATPSLIGRRFPGWNDSF